MLPAPSRGAGWRRAVPTRRSVLLTLTFIVILIWKYLLEAWRGISEPRPQIFQKGLNPDLSLSDLTSLNLSFWKIFTLCNMRRVRLSCAGWGARALESGCPTLLLPSCVPLSKFLNLAVPQFPYFSKYELGLVLSHGD